MADGLAGRRVPILAADGVERVELDPSYLVTHRFSLEAGRRGYEMFRNKEDDCVRAIFAVRARSLVPQEPETDMWRRENLVAP